MKSRIYFLDYMRVIACFMVIMVHSCEFFFIDGNNIGIRNLNDGFWVSIIDSAFRCSVPLFVMISAYLLVPIIGDVKSFFTKRMTRVVIPFLLWSILYATLPYLWGGMQAVDVKDSLLHLIYNFNDESGHMWFVYMLIGIYLFMPIISPWLEKADKKAEIGFLVLWLLSSLFPYVRAEVGYIYGESYWNEYNMLWYFSGFLGYLVLAHYIRCHIKWNSKTKIIVGILSYFIGYYITADIWYNRIATSDTLQQLELSWRFCTPNVIMMSFGAFIIIQTLFSTQHKGYKLIKSISILSYGIYLMHIFVLGAVYSLLGGVFSTPITICVVGILTFALCCIIAKLVSYIPYSKYIIG